MSMVEERMQLLWRS